jgi:tetratricopeptide (TPR) repeat protein
MKYKEAIDSFQKVLALDPNHTASETRIRMAREKLALPESERITTYKKECWARGTDYYKQEKWTEAAKEFRRILRVDPNHAPSNRLLRECESNLGK